MIIIDKTRSFDIYQNTQFGLVLFIFKKIVLNISTHTYQLGNKIYYCKIK